MNTLQNRLRTPPNVELLAHWAELAADRIDALEAEANRLSEHATVIRNQRDEALAKRAVTERGLEIYKAHYNDLYDKLAALTKDAKRLNWIAVNGSFGVDSATGEVGGNGQTRKAATRQNIDAAIAAQKEQS